MTKGFRLIRACIASALGCGLLLIAPAAASAGGKTFKSYGATSFRSYYAQTINRSGKGIRNLPYNRSIATTWPGRRFDRIEGKGRPKADRSHDWRWKRHYFGRPYIWPVYGYGYDSSPNLTVRYSAPDAPDDYKSPPREPFQAKLIHIGESGGLLESFDTAIADAEDVGEPTSCLSVNTQILVEGQSMDAVGEACMYPDGTWRLRPTE